jgi:hypothetical protein
METHKTESYVAPVTWEVKAIEGGLQIHVRHCTEDGWDTKSLTVPTKDFSLELAEGQ